tara:strand:+ start:1454 stop:1678 length:225 start_codon:yes stop_codon:yes gene_type:complete
MTNPKDHKFYEIMSALTEIDKQIADISTQIHQLKEDNLHEEECPDELYANKAVLETVKNLCINALIEGKAQGEA